MGKILQAIKNQRWYSFEDYGEIVFDSNSGLFWTSPTHDYYYYDNAKNYAKNINLGKFGGFSDWRFPTPAELAASNEKTFNLYSVWCLQSEDIQEIDATTGVLSKKMTHNQSAKVILCRRADSTDSKDILDMFLKNQLIPHFEDAKINQLYLQIYSGKLDYKIFVEGYDLEAVEQSPLQYYDAVVAVADEVLEFLEEYPDNLKFDEAKHQIRALKFEAAEFSSRLKKIYCSRNILRELAELEREPRPSFQFVVENLIQMVKFALKQV